MHNYANSCCFPMIIGGAQGTIMAVHKQRDEDGALIACWLGHKSDLVNWNHRGNPKAVAQGCASTCVSGTAGHAYKSSTSQSKRP